MAKYFSVVLDQVMQDYLKRMRMIAHPVRYCHHVTVAFNPTLEQIAEFTPLIGQRVHIHGYEIWQDEKCQALRVKMDAPCLNAHPHVTLSCAEGVKPVYSNELLSKPRDQVKIFGMDLNLAGEFVYGN